MCIKYRWLATLCVLVSTYLQAQNAYELNSGWQCVNVAKVKETGQAISVPSYKLSGWMPAVVPGTVLTTLLENKKVPDPFYGMNNEKIADIYDTGREYYTYWFAKDFKETVPKGEEQVWLHFRGINYSCDVYLNGKKLNAATHYGMFLRQTYNITNVLSKDGNNRLAVIVHPPDPVGNAKTGQGGDGMIAKNVSHQYVAGWDWIQPIRDRNTGIWDKVTIEKTGIVNLKNPHVVTLVPGVRKAEGPQQPATIKVSAELENTSTKKVEGTLQYTLDGQTVSQKVSLDAQKTTVVQLPDFTLQNPKLWWPHGYGKQPLYDLKMQFTVDGKSVSDQETVSVGVREIQTEWNAVTRSKQVAVNGQKIFIKGGNWIISDAMLRFTDARYDAEIRFHRDMNLNLIRIWGGALSERPEFYKACDKYGMLVMQDFWVSGDCNGRWVDPVKKEDQWTRRKYPDDHKLFLRSAEDQIKMIRNYASLAMWCGGNEITPPEDILIPLRDSILPELDGTRWFIDYSNSDDMSYNFLGGNGDGPYGIQPINRFWEHRTFPFNSEVGSVGVGDYESLERFIPSANMTPPHYSTKKIDPVWDYHKYIGYDEYLQPYGEPTEARDFAKKAQLVNYDQYRALMEGFSAHMWDWYTGTIIWKTQNPWTAMRGQMYDYYLDVNACLYGLRSGSEPLHIMYNPVDGMVMIVNNTFETKRDLMLTIKAYTISGKDSLITQVFNEIGPSTVRKYVPILPTINALRKEQGVFLSLKLLDVNKKVVSDNFYWLPDASGNYSGLNKMAKASVQTSVKVLEKGKIELRISNPAGGAVAFFNRVALVDPKTKKRLLPVFFSDNYVSVLPGEEKTVVMEYTPDSQSAQPLVSLSGWNVEEKFIPVK
ncbi:glycoside hydrolase family 2 protein [Xanthocytophaga flava]|uniref:glycoside hydrolase family 2 protein n=1 Tax=Xanthocytophaga flava TaxID=3048013 RepID=UPI0028D22E66|nr:glycoside hydrolase family 2 TIM barrel-domain containing protein [Xanthocytophaga flavus]MDJ1466492.1 glycoside hydrolase family 2 TIM barrel-domain containing protein [Xanthocytophaga flavus]